jgi:hypothetical protein
VLGRAVGADDRHADSGCAIRERERNRGATEADPCHARGVRTRETRVVDQAREEDRRSGSGADRRSVQACERVRGVPAVDQVEGGAELDRAQDFAWPPLHTPRE